MKNLSSVSTAIILLRGECPLEAYAEFGLAGAGIFRS